MAAAKKKKPKEPASKIIIRKAVRCGVVLLALLIGWMLIEGSSVRLKSATLPVDDLPASFEGTRVLYLSDIHINSLNSVEKVSAMMEELSRLQPDLLLLGGDYTNFDPIMRISSGSSGKSGAYALETEYRDLFFLSLADFETPLGKFGVAGENDNLLERSAGSSLAAAMRLGGVTLLRDEAHRIYKGTDCLTLVGVDDWSTGLQDTRTPASAVSSGECVILLCHNPEAIPSLNNQPASDGMWIDAALAGHTHGGSVSLFGAELFSPLGHNERFHAGWHMENSAKVLISRGVGNVFFPLRLNAAPEAHLLTLTRSLY